MRNEIWENGDPKLDQLVGIISFGDNCTKQGGVASAHTQVNKFLPWIRKILEENSCKVLLRNIAGVILNIVLL